MATARCPSPKRMYGFKPGVELNCWGLLGVSVVQGTKTAHSAAPVRRGGHLSHLRVLGGVSGLGVVTISTPCQEADSVPSLCLAAAGQNKPLSSVNPFNPNLLETETLNHPNLTSLRSKSATWPA